MSSNEDLSKPNNIYEEISQDALAISKRYHNAPVVIIIAGDERAGVPRTITAFANLVEGKEGRLRDLLGILQVSIQIETLRHFPMK